MNNKAPDSAMEATVNVERFAQGGETVAHLEDGRVVFIRGAVPGDVVKIQLTEVKKKFARAVVTEVLTPSPDRVAHRCPAAAAGAGCCDYSQLSAERELEYKAQIVLEQLRRIGNQENLPDPELVDFGDPQHWRTRVRLGVDKQGRAGFRAARSQEIISTAVCTQSTPGLVEDIVGSERRFRPGAEIVVAIGSDGVRHVVESRKAARGSRVERVDRVLEGSGEVSQSIDSVTFTFPATGFWQAHHAAPAAYSETVEQWVKECTQQIKTPVTAWDLYGGVGAFVPALANALPSAEILSVEMSPYARQAGEAALEKYPVRFVSGRVEREISALPAPVAVVLDPPRQGAGAQVISSIAAKNPQAVIHVGCDAATFARDVKTWSEHGYRVQKLRVFNAFPATHHVEVFGLLVPTPGASTE